MSLDWNYNFNGGEEGKVCHKKQSSNKKDYINCKAGSTWQIVVTFQTCHHRLGNATSRVVVGKFRQSFCLIIYKNASTDARLGWPWARHPTASNCQEVSACALDKKSGIFPIQIPVPITNGQTALKRAQSNHPTQRRPTFHFLFVLQVHQASRLTRCCSTRIRLNGKTTGQDWGILYFLYYKAPINEWPILKRFAYIGPTAL